MWAANYIVPANILFYSLYCDIISQISLKITQAFHGFAEKQTVFWDFKIRNSVRITKGSDNGDSDNQGPTVLICEQPAASSIHTYSLQ